MKIKYFIFGFFSCFISFIAIYFYFKNTQEASVKEALANENENKIEIEVYPIATNVIDSLKFLNVQTDTKFCITDDSINYTFINYWATWCIPCVVELPEFEKLIHNNNQEFENIKFIFASREKVKKIINFINKNKINLPYYNYNKNDSPNFINHTSIPTSYFIDEKNLLVYKFSGLQKWNSEFNKSLLNNLR